MILNIKIGVFMDFFVISRASCAKFTADRPRQGTYETFSVEHRF